LCDSAQYLNKRDRNEEADEDGDKEGSSWCVGGQVGSLRSAPCDEISMAHTKSDAKLQKLTVNPIKLDP